MKRVFFVLFLTALYSAFFAVASEGSGSSAAVISIFHSPEIALTDESGAFSVSIALKGQVTDDNIMLPLSGVTVTLPYYSETLTAITDSKGEYVTQKITISGTVVDSSNKPVPNAWVSVCPQLVLDTTDESGMLNTGGSINTGVSVPLYRQKISGISLTGNRLMIASSGNVSINVTLFNVNGQKLFSSSIGNLNDGSSKIRLPDLPAASRLIKVEVGTSTAVFRRAFLNDSRNLIVQKAGAYSGNSVAAVKSYPPLFKDTLVAFADGYHTGYAAVAEGTTSGAKIVLKPSNPWKPSGPQDIERQGGMVKIKAKGRSFSMGQPIMVTDDILLISWQDEVPSHPVNFFYDFWMDTTEVTQKQYTEVMSAAYPNFQSPEWKPTYGVGDNIPAYSMSLGDAILYCNARSKAETLDTVYSYNKITGEPGSHCELGGLRCNYYKNGYRLPTEAEWEYACRAGTVTDFYWNKNYVNYPLSPADTAEISMYALWVVNSNKSSDDPGYAVKKGVASGKPNNYGLYDMVGGLLEYTIPGELYYSYEAVEDPKPLPTDEVYPVLRGGNWGNDAVNLRSSCRKWAFTGNYDYWFRGFRTVREIFE